MRVFELYKKDKYWDWSKQEILCELQRSYYPDQGLQLQTLSF